MQNTTSLKPGDICTVLWEANTRGAVPVKSNFVDGHRTKKIVLPDVAASATMPQPGESWTCRVEREINPGSAIRGAIVVKPLTTQLDHTFPGVWVDPVKARLMSIVLRDPKKNLMLIGDQGIGKSTLSRAVSAKLGWKFRKISGGLLKKAAYMLGSFLPSAGPPSSGSKTGGGQLTFVWNDSPLVKAIREAGANPNQTFLVMIDEYSRIDEDARDALLDIIEGEVRELALRNGEMLRVPENLRFMAAANEGHAFTVRKTDAAAKDRWVVLKVEHMPESEELEHCLTLYPNCLRTSLAKAIQVINLLRQKRHDLKMRLSQTISTRATQNVAMFLQGGIDLKTALMTAVANQFEGDASDVNSEAGRVAQVITSLVK